MKLHEVVIHKNVFSDCVKYVWYRTPIIVHNNARCHTTTAVTDLLRGRHWKILENPPYSPDVSPCDYDLFAKVEKK